jgi:glycosyltransferase involved in cell wall biosynthesis
MSQAKPAIAAESEPLLTVVVPVFNEVESVGRLYKQITRALEGLRYEIICIDDGSTDGSFQKLRRIHRRDGRMRVVRFRRNFGQTPAFAAGFDLSRGEWVVTIDADLQNDPADIPMLLERAQEGYDVVSGWRVKRKDGFIMRKLPSLVANWMIRRMTGVRIHDYGCSLKIYHRDVVKNVRLYGELHRFIPAVAASMGITVCEMPVNHRARTRGKSKYTGLFKTISRATKVFLDLLTVRFLLSYSTRPIHIFGGVGLFCSSVGVALGAYLTYMKLVYGQSLSERPLLMLAVLLIMVGVQFITLGFLGELVVRTYHESQRKPIYAIRESLG